MTIEQIDTSSLTGKNRVMQLAAAGRRVAFHPRFDRAEMWRVATTPAWNWESNDYGIIAEEVEPAELWVVNVNGEIFADARKDVADRFAVNACCVPKRYVYSEPNEGEE